MTGKIENNQSFYYNLLGQLGLDNSVTFEKTQQLLDIRKGSARDLQIMRELVGKIRPTPQYCTFGSPFEAPEGTFTSHSADSPTLTNALLLVRAGEQSRFTVDANKKIVAAGLEAIIPVVDIYTPVIKSTSTMRLKSGHPAYKLYSHARKVLDNIEKKEGPFEFMVLLLAEGVNEKIDNFPEFLKSIYIT